MHIDENDFSPIMASAKRVEHGTSMGDVQGQFSLILV